MALLVDSAAAPMDGPQALKAEEALSTPPRPPRTAPSRSPALISCLSLGPLKQDQLSPNATESRRGERRSKAQALSAMSIRADSSSSTSLPAAPNAARHATRQARRRPPLPPLVFDTSDVKPTSGARPIATGASTPRFEPPRSAPRAFGLEEAPTFYPTWDEFQDPLQYIQWTASPSGGNGVAYGIVKIVPPEGWHMDFVADEQTFRFRTRVQRLNELSAEGRVSQNYNEQLTQFHAQQGHGRVHIPQLAHRPIDLHALKQAVPQPSPPATDSDAWAKLATALGYDVEQYARAPSALASAYERLVAPFEAFLAGLRAAPSKAQGLGQAATDVPNASCVTCSHPDPAVVCDECEAAFHLACVQPPLHHAPRGTWVCPSCLVHTGGDFGFEDGETHSLYSFWQRCDGFERMWAEYAAQRGDADATAWANWATLSLQEREDLVERTFWHLVHAHDVLVDVEYGADVHSTTHGHASPTLEAEPRNPYARSGWNLHNLPILPGSLLRYIRSDISGMTVPWIYIGMMFSAFCWHNEDHYTYSINYQHMGATKTWYGVPGADAEAFEAAMERIAPELFAADPALLLQLVTMMSPALALREGVRMYACHQRPNEFVVTFPKAYHAGLNHGFNVNEAVNFAMPDWIMDDLACVRRYQKHARVPVFSHDELLVTIALHHPQLSTALWLQHAFREMVDRELAGRARIRAQITAHNPEAATDEAWDAATEVSCAHCKTLCYLSHVVRSDDSPAACLAHAEEVHGSAVGTLRVRHPDSFLTTHSARLAERAAVPVAWQQRVRRYLEQHPRPPLRMLDMLVQEGEKITMPLPELPQLRAFLARAAPLVAQAQAFLPKRHPKPARRGGRRAASPPASPPPAETDRTPQALLALQARIPTLPFEAPELQAIDGVVDQMHAFCQAADTFLCRDVEARDAAALVDEAERTLAQGALLHLDLPPVHRLRTWIAHVRWFAEVHRIHTGFLTGEEVDELLTEGRQSGVPSTHPLVQRLEARAAQGRAWSERARALLDEAPVLTRAALSDLVDVPPEVATPSDVRARVHTLQHKAAQWEETIADLYHKTHPSRVPLSPDAPEAPPRLAEARQVLAEAHAARLALPFARDLEEAIALHDRWEEDLAHILQGVCPPDEPASDAVRALCERTVRCAHADALHRGCRDEPTYAPRWSYPPVPYPAPRSACDDAPCLCFARTDRAASVTCATCYTVYHLRCLGRKAKPPRGWRCAFCDDTQLPAWLQARRGVSQLPLVALLQNPAYQRDQFRFLPSNYVRLQSAVRATVEFGVAACMQFRAGALPATLLDPVAPALPDGPSIPLLKHVARRALGCPIDILLIADATPQPHIPSILDVCRPAFHVPRAAPKAKRPPKHARTEGDSAAPRKRAKRARFQFAEEELPPASSDLYCYCRAPDNGTMVQCDRCSHWFHSACMGIDDPQALQDKWFCPVCSFRLRTKYPWAEIKIRDGTRALPADVPPDVFVDVTASLKSQAQPVLKRQPWISGKRIILTLSHFEPAVPAEEAGTASPVTDTARPAPPAVAGANHAPTAPEPPAPAAPPAPLQPPSLPLTLAEERHRAGRANLLRRGVSEAMMHRYSVGWNGESIVCQMTPDCHILLGPHIVLARDDPDGTHLLRMAMDGLVPWARRITVPARPPLAPMAPRPVPTVPPFASCAENDAPSCHPPM
ncbi:hypothetical protein MEQU1_002311 [Malassezia equina]|uniref:[histone H3]-trimethyl-L-lysine(4) demethylase n=1 Tax=Malassezia equina TaxID=1381935 RepID=A0AAF0IZL2_9BASI|nr:hypothetical protein MEQU1_002311 [Malassezia equina]